VGTEIAAAFCKNVGLAMKDNTPVIDKLHSNVDRLEVGPEFDFAGSCSQFLSIALKWSFYCRNLRIIRRHKG